MTRDILRRIANGWRPFLFQVPNWQREERLGYIRADYDERGRVVLEITQRGRDYLASVDRGKQ